MSIVYERCPLVKLLKIKEIINYKNSFKILSPQLKRNPNIYSHNRRNAAHTTYRRTVFYKEKKVEKFIIGLAIGMAGGALIVANNCKLLNLVKKNQEDIMKKAEQYIDSKLETLENAGEQSATQSE